MSIHPDDIKRVKGQGFLNNKGTDCFNARTLTTNGNVSTQQIRAIAEAADRFGCGRVQFTSRMTVELPGIPYDKIEEFQAFLGEYGLYTGGTLCAAAKILKEHGATKVYAAVSHCLLSGVGKEKLLNPPEIEQLITTDAVPNIDTMDGRIKVVSVAPLFGEAIRRIHDGKSVSSLFYLKK